jgi:hypothetical protein
MMAIMKNKLLRQLIFIAVCLSLALLHNSCNTKDDDDNSGNNSGPTPTIVSKWHGTFTGNVEDGVLTFTLYSDNTIKMVWVTESTAYCDNATGSYSLNGNTLSFNVSGTACAGDDNSGFGMSGAGNLSGDAGNGNYNIDFSQPEFLDQTGTWTVSLTQ